MSATAVSTKYKIKNISIVEYLGLYSSDNKKMCFKRVL